MTHSDKSGERNGTSPVSSLITNLIESGSISVKNDSSCPLYSSDRWICHILHCHNKDFLEGEIESEGKIRSTALILFCSEGLQVQ
jgi:hypothetical protein